MTRPRSLGAWLVWLAQAHPRAIDLGLERVRAVYDYLPPLSPDTRVVTVAGTNGKGSCVAALSEMARASGARFGAYTSPHVQNFTERLCIDGAPLSEQSWCESFECVEQARLSAGVSLSFFEFTTLAALRLLSEYRVELALLEVGLGGLLDAVNVIDADVAVVTQVAIDHTDYLGTSREEIAAQKAGILRPGRPVVVADPDPADCLVDMAKSQGACPYLMERDFCMEATTNADRAYRWRGTTARGLAVRVEKLPPPVLHEYSVSAAIQVWQLLYAPSTQGGLDMPGRAACRARLTGRWQVLRVRMRRVVLDVAHNPAAARYLSSRIGAVGGSGKMRVVLGMCADKDMSGFVRELLPQSYLWYPVRTADPRSAKQEELVSVLRGCGARLPPVVPENIPAALDAALAESTPDDLVLVCGSFSVVGEALDTLGRHTPSYCDREDAVVGPEPVLEA